MVALASFPYHSLQSFAFDNTPGGYYNMHKPKIGLIARHPYQLFPGGSDERI
jgi:hypothetical protein